LLPRRPRLPSARPSWLPSSPAAWPSLRHGSCSHPSDGCKEWQPPCSPHHTANAEASEQSRICLKAVAPRT
jgi:hypothetical protein